MRTLSKAHELLHQFAWLGAGRTDDIAFKIVAPPAPTNLHPDLMVSSRSQQKLQYSLIIYISVTDQITSLVCLLIDSSLGAVIAAVYGNYDGHRCGRSQRQTSSRLARQLLRSKITPRYRTLSTEDKYPSIHYVRPATSVFLNQIYHIESFSA